MQKLYSAVLRALVLVQTYLNENAPVLGSVNASTARQTLDDVIGKLDASWSNQMYHTSVSSMARADHEASRRTLLVHHMRGIVRVAKSQASNIPALATVTAPNAEMSTPALLKSAENLGKVAEQHHDLFVGALGPDYLTQLNAAVTDVQSASGAGQNSRAKRGATASTGAEASRGRKAVAVLDVLVRRQLEGPAGSTAVANADLLAEWNSRRKVVVTTQSASSGDTPAAGSTPTSGATTASTVAVEGNAQPSAPAASASPVPAVGSVTPSEGQAA